MPVTTGRPRWRAFFCWLISEKWKHPPFAVGVHSGIHRLADVWHRTVSQVATARITSLRSAMVASATILTLFGVLSPARTRAGGAQVLHVPGRPLSIRRMLVWALLATASSLCGCTGVPATSEQAAQVEEQQQRFDRTQDCRQMRRMRLDHLTPAQNAEITKNMERAGCGGR